MGLSLLKASGSRLLDLIYPPRCFACSQETDQPHGLCGACWTNTSFISGTPCETCGVPLPGDVAPFICDACITFPPPWSKGRAALLYEGGGKQIALSFKNMDRTDMALPLSRWLYRAGGDVLEEANLIAPVPLHWSRLFKRGFNQSGLLAGKLARLARIRCQQDLLQRTRATEPQGDRNREERFDNLRGAIRVNPAFTGLVEGKTITLIDDVLTTGATLSTCTSALVEAGAHDVQVLVLARVARERG